MPKGHHNGRLRGPQHPRWRDDSAITADVLRRMYIDDRQTTEEIARAFGTNRARIARLMKRHAIPLRPKGELTDTPLDRFRARYVVAEGGCWNWTGYREKRGYGWFSPRSSGRHSRAHTWSYEHFKGPVPPGLTVDHVCRNTSCVNPAHLEVVTRAENARRALRVRHATAKGEAANAAS